MLVTLYHLYFLACLGCTPHDTGRLFRAYPACEAARPTRFSYCVRELNDWLPT